MPAESLTAEALALPAAERLRLVQQLWESLHADPDALPLSGEQLVTLDRRAAEMERDAALGSSWEAVRARVLPKP